MYSEAENKASQYVETLALQTHQKAYAETIKEDYIAGFEAGAASAMSKLLSAKAAFEKILRDGGNYNELASISIAAKALEELGFRK